MPSCSLIISKVGPNSTFHFSRRPKLLIENNIILSHPNSPQGHAPKELPNGGDWLEMFRHTIGKQGVLRLETAQGLSMWGKAAII